MLNWHTPSVNPPPHLTPAFRFPALFFLSVCILSPCACLTFIFCCLFCLWSLLLSSCLLVFIRLSLLYSGVRPAYTNNRVPVLQRCGVQGEPLSPGQGARDGVRSGSQRTETRKGRESEGGHCVPPTLTPAKGYLEEKGISGFGATRKRPLGPKSEQEDMEREERERVSHPEKRAKISTGENFLNIPPPFSSNYLPPLFICFLCICLILFSLHLV